jgi:hypothetical protein
MQDPARTVALALGLSASLENVDILPMYVVFMALTPLVLRLIHRGYLAGVIVGSVSLWLLAQTELSELITSKAEELLGGERGNLTLGIYFDLLGWQLLFAAGLLVGYLVATGRNLADVLARPGWEPMLYIAMVLAVMLAPVTLVRGIILLGGEGSGTSLGMTSKDNAAPIYLVSFVVDAFIITWLLVAGSASTSALLRSVSQGVTAVVTWRPLVFLGRHSLQAYAAHVLCFYALAFATERWRLSESLADLLLVTSLAPMFLGAWLHSWVRKRALAST